MQLDTELKNYLNSWILDQTKDLSYSVSDFAPNTEIELFNASTLTIWSGSSDDTIYQDKAVNWAFRALHDASHLETRLDFTIPQEIELGRIQAAKCGSDIIAELIYIEIAGQAEYYAQTGQFVKNQVEFTLNQLNVK